MCGIAGLFSFSEPADGTLLSRMNERLRHRGPDTTGTAQRGRFGLTMTRLRVIDLSGGDQPISNEDESLTIVFNGEIYNYQTLREQMQARGVRFKTCSDTEVVLRLYESEGEKCLERFNGMFAFALYDAKNQELFLARDRLGIKPLYYTVSDKGFAFASEVKALCEVPWVDRRIDYQALSHFLSYNYLPAEWTPFRGVRQLMAGHWMRVAAGGKPAFGCYWDVPEAETADVSEEEALKTIEELLHRSIERRLVSDVPVGAFLSGGLDSSSVVALFSEHRSDPVETFSVGFEEPTYDEIPYARKISEYFGTRHHEIYCGPDDMRREMRPMVWHADNWLADQACLPLYVVSRLAKRHVTVSLSGDGGDELFVGYPTIRADQLYAGFSKIPEPIRRLLINPAVGRLPASFKKLSFEYKAKKFIQAAGYSPEKAHYWWRTIHTDDEKQRLLRPGVLKEIGDTDGFAVYERFFSHYLQRDFGSRCLYADLKVWLGGNNLCKLDSMSMAHGLESRVPFLDHELVEYVAALPFSLKFRRNIPKYLLKKIMKKKLPECNVTRKKAGWHMPMAQWFYRDLRDYVSAILMRPHPVLDDLLCRDQVRRLVREHTEGRTNHGFKLYGLLVLHHWADQFFSPAADEGMPHDRVRA